MRQGSTAWIPQNGETSWIYEKLVTMVKDANNELWNFELTGFLEDLQYTTYNGKGKKKGDHYGAHLDFDGNCTRKISIVVQLTEPEEYEGGGNWKFILGTDLLLRTKQWGHASFFLRFYCIRLPPLPRAKETL